MYRTSDAADRSLLVATFHGKVFGLARADGTIRWRTEIPGMTVMPELAIEGDVVVVSTHNRLAVLEYASGKLRTIVDRSDAASNEAKRPTMLVDGDLVVLAGSGTVACYTLAGNLVWQQAFRGEGYGEVAMGFPGNVRPIDARD